MEKKYRNPNDYWYYNQRYEDNSVGSLKGCFYSLLGIIIVALVSLLLSGCQTIKYVPVEVVEKEYITKTDTFIQKDSIVFHDSVYIHSKGDTVWYEKWHTKYKDRIVTRIVVDSFIKRDSVSVPYMVEKNLTRWQKMKMDFGGGAIFALIGMIIAMIIVIILKMRNLI